MVKNVPANAGDERDSGSIPGLERSPGEEMATHSSILPWKSHGQRNLAGVERELDTTECTQA